jgi:hypothetical protein
MFTKLQEAALYYGVTVNFEAASVEDDLVYLQKRSREPTVVDLEDLKLWAADEAAMRRPGASMSLRRIIYHDTNAMLLRRSSLPYHKLSSNAGWFENPPLARAERKARLADGATVEDLEAENLARPARLSSNHQSFNTAVPNTCFPSTSRRWDT